MDIAGKVVVITGASSGIGKATAEHLAGKGAHVVLGARGADKLERVCEAIQAVDGSARALPTDVSRLDDVRALVDFAQDSFGRLDVMISNAGAMPLSPLQDFDTEGWERMIDVNIKGVLWAIATALPVFLEQGFGHFVTVGSTAAHRMLPNLAVYGGTKSAVNAIMEGLRQEQAGKVRVTTIHPGFTDTDFASHVRNKAVRDMFASAGEGYSMSPRAVAAAIAHAIEQPDEVNIGEIVIRSTVQP